MKPTVPVNGESLRGLVVRACHANHLPNSFGLLRHFGVNNRQHVTVSENADLIASELAYALGTTTEEIEIRRYVRSARQRRAFFGLELHCSRIETGTRRFSPTALAGQRIHLASWELKDLPFCTVGWDMLQDRCPCSRADGVVQRWERTWADVGHCDDCGDPLSRLEPIYVPAGLRDALSFYAGLADPLEDVRRLAIARLPAALSSTHRGRVFDFVTLVARLIDPPARTLPPELHVDRLEALHDAAAAVLDWPYGFARLRRSDAIGSAHWQRAAREYMALSSPRASQPIIQPSTERDARRGMPSIRAAATKRDSIVRARRDKEERVSGLCGLSKAARIARVKSTKLLEAWNDGRVTKHYRQYGERMIPAFERREMAALTGLHGARVEARALGVRLGISQFGVEQLAALGLLPAYGSGLAGMGPFFEEKDVDGFLESFNNHRRAVVDDPTERLEDTVTLRDAMRSVTGRPKPWGPVFASLLKGDMRFALDEGSTPLVDRLHVARADVARIPTHTFSRPAYPDRVFANTMGKVDALDCLNLGWQRGEALASLEHIGSKRKRFKVEDVEELARRCTTTPEVASLLGLPCSSAHSSLLAAGITSHGRYLWDRREAARLADRE
ncbi:MAG: hypothetical protein ACRYG4_14015 [Janthinobacterium lividum]